MKNSEKFETFIIQSEENLHVVKCHDAERQTTFFFIVLEDKSGRYYVKSGAHIFSSSSLNDCAREATTVWNTATSAKRNMSMRQKKH